MTPRWFGSKTTRSASAPGWIVPLRGNRPNSFAAWVDATSHKAVQVDAAGRHAVRVEQMDAVLDAGDAVGNLGEIAAAHFLLLVEIERGMIGGDGVDLSGRPARSTRPLMPAFAQRRRHDVFRAFEIGPLGEGLVEHQIRDHRFDPQMDAAPRARRAAARASAQEVWTT